MRVWLLALVLIASPSLFAAPAPETRPKGPPSPGAGASMMLDRAREAVDQLTLTSDQKAKVATIFKEARAELEQMKSQLESMEMRDRLAEVREFFDGVRADLALVLTPEQRQQLEQRFERIRNAVAGGPGAGAGPGGAMPPGMLAERLRDAIPKLKLSDEQARKVKELLDDLRPRGEALRQQLEMGDASAREKMRELGQEMRTKIREILTPEQQETLRELMTQPPPGGPRGGGGDGPRGRRPGAGAATRAASAGPDKSDQMMSGDTMMDGAAAGAGAARKPKSPGAPADSEKTPAGPAIGDPAPDFTLTKIDGAQINLASMKGRVIVLVFGSYSAPTFRNRIAAMEKLRSDFGTRATFFVVYSREAHPTGEWEVARNKQDGISVEQARSVEARKSAATTARDKLKITTPILLDTIGNDTALAYGAGTNSAYVIGRDGTIAARQQWFEPLALRRALDAATAAATAKPATKPPN